jgi:hypothetical protein
MKRILGRRRRAPKLALPARHRKHRDPYAPVHYDGIPVDRWLRDEPQSSDTGRSVARPASSRATGTRNGEHDT